MQSSVSRPLHVNVHTMKTKECGKSVSVSPYLQPRSPLFSNSSIPHSVINGKYLLHTQLDNSKLYRVCHITTEVQYLCKILPNTDQSRQLLQAHYRLDGHSQVNQIQEVILGESFIYMIFPLQHGDLHSYVRSKRRVKESEARRLFGQIVEIVQNCHENGIVLRDVKLSKFVFSDVNRTKLKLESLEDCVLLDDPHCDLIEKRHGCPQYVSPEVLNKNERYSGKLADMWGLGVILYALLVGRYPFQYTDFPSLASKIRAGEFLLPEFLSSRAKCLIRSLLRRRADERLEAVDVLRDAWMMSGRGERETERAVSKDQTVPDIVCDDIEPSTEDCQVPTLC